MSMLSVEPKDMTIPTGRYTQTSPSSNFERAYDLRFDACHRAIPVTVAPYVSAAWCKTEAERGSGRGRKRAQRVMGPLPYVTEYQHMLRSEKRITPRAVLVLPE